MLLAAAIALGLWLFISYKFGVIIKRGYDTILLWLNIRYFWN